MSAGNMSGVNCSRLNCTSTQLARVFSASVFGQAGHAFQQHVAVGQQGDQQTFEQMFLTDDDAGHFLLQRSDPAGASHNRFTRDAHGGVGRDRYGLNLWSAGGALGGLIPRVEILLGKRRRSFLIHWPRSSIEAFRIRTPGPDRKIARGTVTRSFIYPPLMRRGRKY